MLDVCAAACRFCAQGGFYLAETPRYYPRQVDQTAEFPERRLFLVTAPGERRRKITSGGREA